MGTKHYDINVDALRSGSGSHGNGQPFEQLQHHSTGATNQVTQQEETTHQQNIWLLSLPEEEIQLPENLDLEEEIQPLELLSPLNPEEDIIILLNLGLPVPNILDQILQHITPSESLSTTMHENREKRYFITVPMNVPRSEMNIRTYPFSIIYKYATLILPTLTEEDLPLPMNNGDDHPLLLCLRMSLAPGGSSHIINEPKMKILLWKCRGCNNQ